MAFKMKGFNPGDGTGMGSAFTKSKKITRKDIRSKTFAEEDTFTPTRFTEKQKREGAGASLEFFGREEGERRKKLKVDKVNVPKTRKTKDGASNYIKVKDKSRKKLTVNRSGKRKKSKETAKVNPITGARTIKLETMASRDLRADKKSKAAEKSGGDPTAAYREKADVGKAQFTGKDKKGGGQGHKGDDKRKRKAKLKVRGKKAGQIQEMIKRKSGIGYRKTGRVIKDIAAIESAKEKQA